MAEKRDWKRYQRNWRAYERFREDEVELFLKKAKDVVWRALKPEGACSNSTERIERSSISATIKGSESNPYTRC